MIIAFSTYSRLPVPQADWTATNRAWSMAFLPLVGVVIGLLLYGWHKLSVLLGITPALFAAVATALPLIVSGGIHLDGLCDTMDALSSHQSKVRKLEILQDAHIGAFGVMACILYLLLWAGCMVELQHSPAFGSVCLVFLLSRAVSGLAVQYLPNARGDGMLQSFTVHDARNRIALCLVGWFFLALIVSLCWNWRLTGWLLIGLGLSIGWFQRIILKQFGGVTGDLIGCYLQICELTLVFALIVGEKVWSFM